MRALNAAEIDGDLGLECLGDGFAEIMSQQNIFGRDRRVGFELENPMAVGLLGSSSASVARAIVLIEVLALVLAEVLDEADFVLGRRCDADRRILRGHDDP